MAISNFVGRLSRLKFDNTFNPYSDRCPIYDHQDAPNCRRELLTDMIQAACDVELDSIWIGRDLGYRGGRRTGLALTDDMHFQTHTERWGISINRPTTGEPVSERTATVIWNMLAQITDHIFLWNVFPLHPHEIGKPFSNRSHNSREREAGKELLQELVKLLNPRQIIAIGNDASAIALNALDDIDITKVRHPSYGGHNIFLSQLRSHYNLE